MDGEGRQEDSKNCYFLDTSTQIERHWADEPNKGRVRADLKGKKLRCSIYVEREYRYKVLRTLTALYTLVTKSSSIGEVSARVDKVRDTGQDLVYVNGRRLLNRFNSVKPVQRRLRQWIEKWENFFYDAVQKDLADCTGCTRAADSPRYENGLYIPPSTQCPPNCKIREFWAQRSKDLSALANIDKSQYTPMNDRKGSMIAIQSEAKSICDGNSPHGESCHQIMSDAVISIEARDSYEDVIIHTMDYDFEHLSTYLGTQVRHFKTR